MPFVHEGAKTKVYWRTYSSHIKHRLCPMCAQITTRLCMASPPPSSFIRFHAQVGPLNRHFNEIAHRFKTAVHARDSIRFSWNANSKTRISVHIEQLWHQFCHSIRRWLICALKWFVNSKLNWSCTGSLGDIKKSPSLHICLDDLFYVSETQHHYLEYRYGSILFIASQFSNVTLSLWVRLAAKSGNFEC